MDQAFYCKNGKVAHTLEDLADILKDMPQDEFSHHVSAFKNDFSNWILQVLQNSDLAGTVRKCTTKEETLAAINEHVMRREVSKRFEAYIEEKRDEPKVSPVVPDVSAQKPVVFEKKEEMPSQIVIPGEAKKPEAEKHVVGKGEAYRYFTLKEFILGVLLGFVLGFVVSKLLFGLVLT